VNRGPVVGNNAGITRALELGAEWIVLLNNDTTVHADIFDRLSDAAIAHPEYAVFGPIIMFMGDPDVVMTDATMFNPPIPRGFFLRKEVPIGKSSPPAVTECDMINGCCLMISADMIRKIGLFDERYFMYHDEADLCLRVLTAGGRLGVIDHPLVWHKGSATSAGTGKKSIRYFDARNLWYLLRKHGWWPKNGRRPSLSRFVYFRYMYHWYCAEREAGNDVAAAAVVDGIADGLAGVVGPYTARRRPTRWFCGLTFGMASKLPRPRAR
jgi:GT2 family glycosyltransferase